ncbi:4-hydroxy-2-ketovalerate aldolase [Roseobacter sp. SK209-2-6]|uniref:glycosyltransferase family 2 protein n=1 Tax=Roseobacter sp. SK209-2-6 TaxID=388739 RepID=UPI0000F3F4B5|nr:glycosyltransferase family A protein [Roseobacter sp. SK209-2-6]EBA14539.1 4-hydroxy-2-ketovalerate aldolase [Roseobacter sp. SK209-2-6]
MQASSAEPDAQTRPKAPLVTVAVSTLGQGISRIRLPAAQAGICYLILLQRPEEAAVEARKPLEARLDVQVIALDSIGLSNSRNEALIRAGTPLLLFADDDQALDPAGILALADAFSQDPDLTLAAGWRAERLPEGASPRQRLTRFNSGRICAPEFMVNLDRIRAAGLCFDPEFGLGAHHGIGEDYIFTCDILSAGLKGVAFPVITGSHPHDSTGDNWSDPRIMRARQAMITRVFGPWAPVIRLAYALKHRRRMGGMGQGLRFFLG